MNCSTNSVACAIDALRRALEQHDWFDILANLVVPLLLGLLTLLVALAALRASRAANKVAEQSNALAERLHVESIALQQRQRRAELATEFTRLSSELFASRLTGHVFGPTDANFEDQLRFSNAIVRTDEPTARKFNRWLSTYWRRTPLAPNDVDGAMRMSTLVADRIGNWIADPERTMESIRNDPPIPGLTDVDPDDPHDYRVP